MERRLGGHAHATLVEGDVRMCLGVPAKLVAMGPAENRATADFGGLRREVALDAIDEPATVGDWVLVHAGFALCRIPPAEVAQTVAMFQSLADEETASARAFGFGSEEQPEELASAASHGPREPA